MSYQADVYQVIIVSPGDVPNERQLAREIVFEWNDINSYDKKICLLPVGWEHNSSPEMGERPQEIINKQILENSDLLIGIFWTRIGSPTGVSISGSVEEIGKHVDSGKPAMLYFSNTPVGPDIIDPKQYKELKRFKVECQKKGLVETFSSIDDLRTKFTRQLSQKIIQHKYFQKNEKRTEENYIEENNDVDIIEALKLSDEEKELIVECSNDPSGHVMKISFIGGFKIQANRKILNNDNTPRTRAIWQEAIENLIEKSILSAKGFKGEIFELTAFGYEVADKLKENL